VQTRAVKSRPRPEARCGAIRAVLLRFDLLRLSRRSRRELVLCKPRNRRVLAGTRRPSRQSLKLFALHRDRRVFDEHWRNWKLKDGVIVDPEGNATTQGQLRAYSLVMQFAAALARRSPEDQNAFYELLRRA
jgi:hypothetical protein